MSKSKVLFILSGSIAAFKAAQVISRLVQDGHEVKTVATLSALKFIGAATLEGLTGQPVLSDLWEAGRAMDHIHLSRWADFGILCPASANSCSRAATGLAGDLVGSLLLAWPKDKPLHIFPAMNLEMYDNPVTQENLAKLSARGFTVHETGAGNLACGEEGAGRLLEPEEILKRLTRAPLGKILITSGATREPIDGIRFISNVSTGRTAAKIAENLIRKGWDVTYLHGQSAALPQARASKIQFGSFAELNDTIRKELGSHVYNAVIHAAAVSDYSVASVNDQNADASLKMKSGEALNVQLKPNFKILPRLKEYSKSKEIKVIGFKLTLNKAADETLRIGRALLGVSVDAVVANDWAQVNSDRRKHPGVLLHADSADNFNELGELSDMINNFIQTGAK